MSKWEHTFSWTTAGNLKESIGKPPNTDPHSLIALTDMEREGWELVSVVPADSDNTEYFLFFKRPSD